MARIGVEQSLTSVSEELVSKGYDVVSLKQESDANSCDCCVISGLDQNVMGIQDHVTNGTVINADGMSAMDVCQRVEHTLSNQTH